MTSQPQSQGARKRQGLMFLRRSQRLWACPTKAPCASVAAVKATATTELEQSWPGSPLKKSISGLYNPLVFPVRGLSVSSSREGQAVLASGLVVACSGGPPRLPVERGEGGGGGWKQAPQGPWGVVWGEEAPGRSEVALPGKRVGAASHPGSGAPAVPQAPAPPSPPSLASGPWGS